jgi:hypothetical protein
MVQPIPGSQTGGEAPQMYEPQMPTGDDLKTAIEDNKKMLLDPESTLTQDQKVALMEENERLMETMLTEKLTKNLDEVVRRTLSENLTATIRPEVAQEVQRATTPLQQEIDRLRADAALKEQQRVEREAQEKKNKVLRTIKLVAGAIGFAVAVTTPIGVGVIALAGVAGIGLSYGAKFGEKKLAEFQQKSQLKATEMARLRTAMQSEPANSPLRAVAESMLNSQQEQLDAIEKKKLWTDRLTKAATYTAPALTGFAIGATLGNVTHSLFENAVNNAVDARLGTGSGGTGLEGAQAGANAGSGVAEGSARLPGMFETVAQSGDSQWSLIQKTLANAYPNATPDQIANATGNIINQAGADNIYSQIFAHRTPDIVGGAVQIGDKLSLADLTNIAPDVVNSLGSPVFVPPT